MPYCPSTLQDHLHSKTFMFMSFLIAKFMSHMAAALQFLHRRKIIHKDIKPSNILCNYAPKDKAYAAHWWLTDFGSVSNKAAKAGHYPRAAGPKPSILGKDSTTRTTTKSLVDSAALRGSRVNIKLESDILTEKSYNVSGRESRVNRKRITCRHNLQIPCPRVQTILHDK